MVTRKAVPYRIFCVSAVIAAALACAPAGSVKRPASPGKMAGPAIALSSRTWDFGTLKRGEKSSGEITVTNAGSEPLTVSLYPTCDCLEARMDSEEVAPGEALPIYMTYLGDEIKDRLTKTLYVESNDQSNPRIAVTVTGRVIPGDGPHLRVSPDPLLFDPEDPLYPEASLALDNIGRADLELKEMRFFGCVADLDPASLPISLTGGGAGLVLRLEKLDGWSGTRWIEIESDDPVHPVKKVSVLEL